MNVGICIFSIAASLIPAFAFQPSASDLENLRKTSSLLLAQRKFAAALESAEKGLALAPEDSLLNLRKGEALTALSQPQQALTALDKAPVTGESQFFRGTSYQMLENHSAARDCFLDAWKRGHEDPYVLYALVRENMALKDKAAGLDAFQLLVNRFPTSAWVHVLLGDAHYEKKEQEQARNEYLEAVKQTPDLFEPNYRLAYMAFEAGDYPAAVKYYQHTVAARPRYTEANVYLGEALRREGRLPDAIEQLRRAIQLDPEASLAYDSLSKALADAGRVTEAVDTLLAAERAFPKDSSFPAVRARLLTRLNRPEEARAAAARATEIIDRKNKDAIASQK